MPYNTTAIPPRKEPTGQNQLPLSRVKKIIGQDPDVQLCSNNAAFVVTLATEMFIQHLTEESLKQAKLERKPRRNIQYKDVANAVSHQDNLEFLEDMVPKTVPLKKIKAAASATQARLRGETAIDDRPPTSNGALPNGSDSPTLVNGSNGSHNGASAAAAAAAADPLAFSTPNHQRRSGEDRSEDPDEQLQLEMRQAAGGGGGSGGDGASGGGEARDGDVQMTG